jgi:hypothetical protein
MWSCFFLDAPKAELDPNLKCCVIDPSGLIPLLQVKTCIQVVRIVRADDRRDTNHELQLLVWLV